MPTYSYRCEACGHVFEVRQRMTDDPLTHCRVCDGRVRRLINNVGLVFKGSGFYVTDNRNGSQPSTSSNGKNGTAKTEGATSENGTGTTTSAGGSTEKSTSTDSTAA